MTYKHIKLLSANKTELTQISKKYLLSLNVEEMEAVQKYFRTFKREPTDCELETIAQTWSEHCKHKTLTASIEYRWKVEGGSMPPKCVIGGWKVTNYDNLLKDTIFRATKELNKKWCISVFKDNAGIIEFDKKNAVAFKVETHNHPSAIEPYGGAGTGIGGVIRDILGVGLGAKPIMNTDVFCFGSLDTNKKIPEDILIPSRIYKGVVSGVRDYGNRMGIPTANGAIIFDDGYIYNPLVYCGTVGILPKTKSFKKVTSGDLILAVGGRTGRDGIHGATFSSLSLNKDIPTSVVQIGNPIIEKKVLDTLLKARDGNLYDAVTDCGAGGFSSAIGELAIFSDGAKVYLEKAPLKYEGLLPWEIWISEAQERMVLAVKKRNLKAILKVFANEDVEATVLGEFTNTGKLEVFYKNEKVASLDMDFLHDGVPKVKKIAVWDEQPLRGTKCRSNLGVMMGLPFSDISVSAMTDPLSILKKLLSSENICSKEWVIRQYDHEVQGHTVIKPFAGVRNDGPSDASVIKPLSTSNKGLVVSNGINLYGKLDTYWMAASAIDEALRNVVAVGGNLEKTALLDNFCWGALDTEHQFGEIVRSCQACYDMAIAYETPFISGKDSLNNKYTLHDGKTVSIPSTLLISAISVIEDIRKCVTMDLKNAENPIYIIGLTKDEYPPKVEPKRAKKQMMALTKAIEKECVASCHDCSEGGIAVALSEMCFSSELGCELNLKNIPYQFLYPSTSLPFYLPLLFSETNSRFIVEVKKEKEKQFVTILKGNTFAKIGTVQKDKRLLVNGTDGKNIIDVNIFELKKCFKEGLI